VLKKTVIQEKSLAFAIRVVNLYKFLCEEKKEYVLSKQLLRSDTSIGAMIQESRHAESNADFIHKFAIAQKECNESIYWLELLYETKYISQIEYNSLYENAVELMKIITSSIITSKKKKGLYNNT